MIIVKSLKYVTRGCLIANVSIEITKWNQEIFGISVFKKDSNMWISMPGYKIQKDDGTTKYLPYIRFTDSEFHKKFNEECLKKIKKYMRENPNPDVPRAYHHQRTEEYLPDYVPTDPNIQPNPSYMTSYSPPQPPPPPATENINRDDVPF